MGHICLCSMLFQHILTVWRAWQISFWIKMVHRLSKMPSSKSWPWKLFLCGAALPPTITSIVKSPAFWHWSQLGYTSCEKRFFSVLIRAPKTGGSRRPTKACKFCSLDLLLSQLTCSNCPRNFLFGHITSCSSAVV